MLAGLRVLLRAPLSLLWTVSLVAVMTLVRCVPGQSDAARWARLQRLFSSWAQGLLRILNVTLVTEGDLPDQPGLLICNHLGYLDIVVLAATLRATFVSKSEVASWPFLGFVVTLLGTIYIDRSRRHDVARVNELIAEALARGRTVIVFAEGTSSDGTDVLPLRPSLLDSGQHGRHPVYYARLDYQTPLGAAPASDAVCWWGDAPFLPHLGKFLKVPSVRALVHFGNETITPADRKSLAVELREKLRALPALRT
ncbi:MAG: lysophospholipid acyltransferase family protein [Pseudomonadota bacterium]